MISENVQRSSALVGGEAADDARLDSTACKSPQDEVLFIPDRQGGRLHPVTGMQDRLRDREKIIAVVESMKWPMFVTLTVDREQWGSPREAWAWMSHQQSRLLTERLGARLWVRVMEFQEKTGDGWPHIHAAVDLHGTGLSIAEFRRRCWKFWRDDWGIGGVDVEKMRSRTGGAIYLAKYITKGLQAIPRWVLELDRAPRMVGYSKDAGELLQQRGLSVPHARSKRKKSRDRETRPLVDRLARSGKYTRVVVRSADGTAEYLGLIEASRDTLLCLATKLPALEIEVVNGKARVAASRRWNERTIAAVNKRLRALGHHTSEAFVEEHRRGWLHSWDEQQIRRSWLRGESPVSE